jgi:hypothetical protein
LSIIHELAIKTGEFIDIHINIEYETHIGQYLYKTLGVAALVLGLVGIAPDVLATTYENPYISDTVMSISIIGAFILILGIVAAGSLYRRFFGRGRKIKVQATDTGTLQLTRRKFMWGAFALGVTTAFSPFLSQSFADQEKLSHDSEEWKNIQSFINKAEQDDTVRSNPKFRDAIKAFKEASNIALYDFDDGINNSSARIGGGQEKSPLSHVGIDHSFLQLLLKKAEKNPAYYQLAIGLLIEPGTFVLDHKRNPKPYIDRARITDAMLPNLDDKKLMKFLAGSNDAVTNAARTTMDYFIAVNKDLLNSYQIFREIFEKETNKRIRSLLVSHMSVLEAVGYSRNFTIPAYEGKEEELFLKYMLFRSMLLQNMSDKEKRRIEKLPVFKSLKKFGNLFDIFRKGINFENEKDFERSVAVLDVIWFLLDPKYTGRKEKQKTSVQ